MEEIIITARAFWMVLSAIAFGYFLGIFPIMLKILFEKRDKVKDNCKKNNHKP